LPSTVAWQAASRLGIAVLAGLFVGWAIGQIAATLAVVLGIYALVQMWNLLRLERWLRLRRVEQPPDMNGPWGEVVATASRIYRRKQYHKSRAIGLLREFRRLTAAMPEGAVLLGPDHEILWFNRRAAEWLDLRRKRDFGIRIENLVRHPDFVAYLRRGNLGEGVLVNGSAQGERSLFFYLVQSVGSLRRLLVVRDVSREVRIESMRKDFVANASHELRSPLTVIAGYLDALADDGQLDAAWKAPVGEMRRQTERMGEIIRDLLELSRLEDDDGLQDDQIVNVSGLLALLRKEIQATEERPERLLVRMDSDANLRGSEREVHSVISNLLNNAVKYTPRNGEIEMRWWTDATGAHLAVRDTGIGIPADHIPRLTERFYRVDSGRSREQGGSGLGLAIVKHALQRHGATLTIESEEGRGSTFTCHFPADRVIARSDAA
jgi:two-component system, OmpR family, phosphate regulon sensor histidine kinase PhoR